jgi:glycerophosphoryl diester phosphodiesterase
MPGPTTRPDRTIRPAPQPFARTRVVAHRGASAIAPENTAIAARRAVALGADAVECDVRRTADGALVVVHDHHLRRTTNAVTALPRRGPWHVADLTLAEVQRLDAGSWFHPVYAGEPVPTLATWAAAVGTHTHLLVEVKEPALFPGIARDLRAELRHVDALRRAVGERRLVVQSFDRAWVEAFRELAPEVAVGVLSDSAPAVRRIERVAAFADQLNLSCWAARRETVGRAQERGLQVHAWTPNSSYQLWRARRAGVDGVITDRPERARIRG